MRVFLIGVSRDDLELLRQRTALDVSLEVVGAALQRDVDEGRVRVPVVDAVLMSPAAVVTSDRDVPELVEELTARERDVLELVADGHGNREIARRLGISEHTVKFHLTSVFGKLGASTRTEAVRRGLELGLIHI